MKTESSITPHENSSIDEERFVATGSTCTCSRVRQHGRLLLKKKLLPTLAQDERRRQALEKEFEIGYSLDHPNIPRYLEFHGDYLLMEYVDGVTLTTFHEQHPNYFKEKKNAQQFTAELCSAIAYLHQHQVLHLDLKPDNILLTRIGHHVKLVDLGYSYQDSYPFTTGGTPGYAASDEEKTPACDIYSLGRIFSELNIASEKVITKCLSADAADRYQSVDELLAAMQPRHFSWKIAVWYSIILLLGIFVWWWMGKNATTSTEPATMVVQSEPTNNALQKEAPDNNAKDESLGNVMQNESTGHVTQDESTEKNVSGDTQEDVNISGEPKPIATKPEKQEILSYNDANMSAAGREYVSKVLREPGGDMLHRNQQKLLPSFVSVTDSILGALRKFVSNDQMPYQLGGLEAYKAAYESLETATLEYGKHGEKVPFWIRNLWMKYNGKPKPYNMFENYLFQQMTTIRSLFQTHVTNYNLKQNSKNDNLTKP